MIEREGDFELSLSDQLFDIRSGAIRQHPRFSGHLPDILVIFIMCSMAIGDDRMMAIDFYVG